MFSILAALRTLILPYGQPPNSPQVIINQDPIPAAIVTYYATNSPFAAGETVINIPLIAQKDASNYYYTSLNIDSGGEMYFCHGTVDSVNGVNEIWRELVPFGFRTGIMYGALENSGSISQVQFGVTPSVAGTQTCAVIVNQSSSFSFDGVSAGRGIITAGFLAASTGAFAGETQIIDIGNATYRAGRVYEVRYFMNSFGSAENVSVYRLRKDSAVGTFIDGAGKENPAGTTIVDHTGSFFVMNSTGADKSRDLVLTAAANVGTITISFGGAKSRVYVKDIGSVNDLSALLSPTELP